MAVVELAMVLAAVSYGAYRLVRSQASARRYLEDGDEEPLELDHLSSSLQRLAQETRTLRISLESPIRSIRELLRADISRTHEDFESIDHALMEASRQVNEWLAMVDRLPERERQRFEEVGGSADIVRAALSAENGAFERSRFHVEGKPTLDLRMMALGRELVRIEAALQVRSRIYR